MKQKPYHENGKEPGGGYIRRLIEALKTLLIFVLVVVMIVLLILLMVGQSNAGDGTQLPEDRMVVYTAGAETGYTKGMETTRVIPAMLMFREAGAEARCLLASTTMGKAYTSLYTQIRLLFGGDAVCMRYDRDTGDALWEACIASDNWIALTYQGILPPSVIRAYTFSAEDSETESASPDEAPTGDIAYIRHALLVPAQVLSDDDASAVHPTAICAVTRDDAGNTAVFRYTDVPQRETALSAAAVTAAPDEEAGMTLDAYIAALAALCADAKAVSFQNRVQMTALKPENNGVYRLAPLALSVWDPETALFFDGATVGGIHDSGIANDVLTMLGMDEQDTDNYYNDAAGNRVYLNADGRLRLSRRGNIRYTASQGGGIPVADYLGYASVGGNYLLSEYLRACDRLLSGLEALDGALGGGDADIFLWSVHTSENKDGGAGGIAIRYVYAFDGIPMLDENGQPLYALQVTCTGGCVTSIDWDVRYAVRASSDPAGEYVLPQSVVRAAMALEYPGETIDSLCLRYLPDRTQPGVMHAVWIMENRRTNT